MGTLSNAPVGKHINAYKLCGETQTFSRTYMVLEGSTYTLSVLHLPTPVGRGDEGAAIIDCASDY